MQAIGVYLAGVFAGGALLAPWLFWLTQEFSAALPELAAQPFHRFVNRSLLFLALVGMIPLLRHLGVRSLVTIGLERSDDMIRRIATGLTLGFVSLVIVATINVALGTRAIHPDLSTGRMIDKLLQAIATAATVAVIEEILFRGAFYGALRRTGPQSAALLGSSAVYAIVHFLESAPLAGNVHWWSGLEILPHMLAGFTDLGRIIPGFFNLTLAGVLLTMAYQRSGNLWMSIGIHAGWIFCLRMFRALTVDGAVVAGAWCGSVKLIDGWLATAALGLVLTAVSVIPQDSAAESQCNK